MAIIQNMPLPGVRVDFQSTGGVAAIGETAGRSAFVVPKSWGPDDVFVEVDGGTNFLTLLGKELKDLVEIRETFKGNGRALIYLPAHTGAAKATATVSGVVATAKYAGSLGNQLSVVIVKETDESITVKTVFNNRTVDEQLNVTGLPASNDFIEFSGTAPTASGTGKLTGGLDGTLSASAYSDFLAGLEKYDFTHIAIGSDDESVKAIAVAKVRELQNLGRPVMLVTNNYAMDFEGVTSVKNSVTLEDGTVLAANDAVYWVAAASAAAETNSLTYAAYPGAVDCERLSHAETVAAVKAGHIVFIYKNDRVRIQQDINTLVTFTDTKNQDFSKNRIVRTMAIIETQVTSLFEESFLGKFVNNLDGRENLKAAIITNVLDPLALANAITYDPEEIVIEQGNNKDTVVVTLPIVINDAMEKLYVQVYCN